MRAAFLGAGNMGRALIRGVCGHGGAGTTVFAWDASADALKQLPPGARAIAPADWFTGSGAPDIVVIAVKPQDVGKALSELAPLAVANPAVVWCSIAAGISIVRLETALGAGRKVCRVMPNTPCLVGEGASAFAMNGACGAPDAALVRELFGSCGNVIEVAEKAMNAVTGLSGSGPAYVYLFIEALIEGGVTAGLTYDTARQLAVQTVRGAAAMVSESGQTPSALKAAVMSPAGTTVRGLMALEEGRFKHAVIRAVTEATRRAEELGG